MTKIRRRTNAAALLVLSTLTLTATASAANRTEIALEDARVIVSPEGATRILLKPTDLGVLEGRLVTDARLELELSGSTATEELHVRVHGVSRGWDTASVSWTYPWEREGGDTVTFFQDTATLRAGRSADTLSLDVSQFVRAWAEGELGPHGFLLTTIPLRGDGFDGDAVELLGALGGSKLVAHWRPMPAVARGE